MKVLLAQNYYTEHLILTVRISEFLIPKLML